MFSDRHLGNERKLASGPARHVINYKQTCLVLCELPKNGDEPKSPLFPVAGSMMPSEGTVTFQIGMRSDAGQRCATRV